MVVITGHCWYVRTVLLLKEKETKAGMNREKRYRSFESNRGRRQDDDNAALSIITNRVVTYRTMT